MIPALCHPGACVVRGTRGEPIVVGKDYVDMLRGKGIRVQSEGHTPGEGRYAHVQIAGRTRQLTHFLFGDPPEGHTWDHVNNDPWDNCPDNVRPATRRQQMFNRPPYLVKDDSIPYKGVKRRQGKYFAAVGLASPTLEQAVWEREFYRPQFAEVVELPKPINTRSKTGEKYIHYDERQGIYVAVSESRGISDMKLAALWYDEMAFIVEPVFAWLNRNHREELAYAKPLALPLAA